MPPLYNIESVDEDVNKILAGINGATVNVMCMVIVSILLMACAASLGFSGDVIPRPTRVQELPGLFSFNKKTTLWCDQPAGSEDAARAASFLNQLVEKPMGYALLTSDAKPASNFIELTALHQPDTALGSEGYTLSVTKDSVSIRANTGAGLFYGVQSLRQLLPAEIEHKEKVTGISWTVACCEIQDVPRYPWRGLMLDVARHYADAQEVMHFLDLMALHKLNRFHWHLTDDQGWRIEIKKYPKLTDIGAWRDEIAFGLDPRRTTHYRADGKYGGFYTQDEIRQVVAYADRLHIMVIPEIEMPGHAQAALAAYPQFSSTKGTHEVGAKAGVMDAIYDPGAKGTFDFLDDVLTEVAGLFPAPFIHIGGDEVPKEPWKNSPDAQGVIRDNHLKDEHELQSYFIKRVSKIVESKNRKLIGWDEILEGGLAPGAVVMSWRGTDGGMQAARAGHDVIMTPTSNLYFDYAQTKAQGQPPVIGGYLPIKTVYAFEPTPKKMSPEQATHVLGTQGNIWTEYMPNMMQVELMAFPRACALSEVAWTSADRKDYRDFQRRLIALEKRFAVMNVNYFQEPVPLLEMQTIGEWTPEMVGQKPVEREWDASEVITKSGKYRVELQYTHGGRRLDVAWVAIKVDGVEIARDTHAGSSGASDKFNTYELTVPEYHAGAKCAVIAAVRSDGGTESYGTVSVALLADH